MSNRSSNSPQLPGPGLSVIRSKLIPGKTSTQPEFSQSRPRSLQGASRGNAAAIWIFGLKFGGLMAMYYVLILTPFCDRLLYSYLAANAGMTNGILNWLGQDSHVSEITISSARFAITIRRGCDAIEPSWFFAAALLSFPAPFRRKLLGILAGALFFQALNLLRIVSLYFIGIHQPRFFSTAHVEVWPAIFIVAAILLWIAWMGWARRSDGLAQHAAA